MSLDGKLWGLTKWRRAAGPGRGARRGLSATAAGARGAAAGPFAGVRVTPFPFARAATFPEVVKTLRRHVAAVARGAPSSPPTGIGAASGNGLASCVARTAGLRPSVGLTRHALGRGDRARHRLDPFSPAASAGQARALARPNAEAARSAHLHFG